MAFDVYPAVGAPFTVAAGRDREIEFVARIGPDEGNAETIFLRIVQIGASAGPAIAVSADSGPFVEVPEFPTFADIKNGSGATVADVNARRQRHGEAPGVALVRIHVEQQVADWRLRILNRDAQPHNFMFVVADKRADTGQPWIDVSAVPDVEVLTHSTTPVHFEIVNNGTGPLQLDDPGVTDLAGFGGLTPGSATLAPNSRAAFQATFAAPDAPGRAAAMFTYTSNDTTAQLTDGHSRRLRLSATIRAPLLWAPGDILVACAADLDSGRRGMLVRVDPRSGAQKMVSVGQLLRDPAGVAVEPDGNVVIIDKEAFQNPDDTENSSRIGGVIRVNRVTGQQTDVSSEGFFGEPSDLVVLPDGTIVVADIEGVGELIQVDPMDGEQKVLTDFGDEPDFPNAVARDPTGTLVVLMCDTEQDDAGRAFDVARVLRVTRDGDLTEVENSSIELIGVGDSRSPYGFRGIAVGGDGGILVAVAAVRRVGPDGETVARSPASVIRVDPNGGPQKQVSIGRLMNEPSGLTVVETDNILVSELPGFNDDGDVVSFGGLIRIAPGGSQVQFAAGGLLRSPGGVTVVPAAGT